MTYRRPVGLSLCLIGLTVWLLVLAPQLQETVFPVVLLSIYLVHLLQLVQCFFYSCLLRPIEELARSACKALPSTSVCNEAGSFKVVLLVEALCRVQGKLASACSRMEEIFAPQLLLILTSSFLKVVVSSYLVIKSPSLFMSGVHLAWLFVSLCCVFSLLTASEGLMSKVKHCTHDFLR